MFSRIIPPLEQIEQFRQPLTQGEWHLLKFLNESLKRDELFQGGDISKYNGWLIFVQPYLNGSRPDIIIFHPYIGVQIFEVKDWNLNNYSFENKKGGDKISVTFCFKDSHGACPKKSPIKQVEYYKEKIAGQLLPQIGESFDSNSQQYGLIKTAVYFHNASTAQAQELFKSQIKDFSKFPVFGCDTLLKSNLTKVVPDSYLSQSIYWQKDWNKELLFWLHPPFHAIEQGIPLELKADQKKFAEPQTGHYRVRGVAGSGKTQVLAYRAGKLASQGYHVLVLTFNLTLGHLIHDMVRKSPFAFEWDKLTITYFHGFCKDILNEYGEEWPRNDGDEESLFREIVPNKVLEVISKNEYKRYDAILIDEGQDFCIEWYSMLCDFLTGRDEVVVVCDKKQNIYKRQMEWLDKRRRGVEKFGDWIELKKIIRLPEQIAKVCVDFSEEFNLNQDIRILKVEKPDLFNQFDDHVVWWNIGHSWLDKVDEAFEIIKGLATHKHPSDTVILLPFTKWGFECVYHFESEKHIYANHVFETDSNEKYHRHKKAFWMGDSRLKMSTIHSFKGWEVPNVIVVISSLIPENDAECFDMIVYTAMTRAKENLIVINANERYRKFGEKYSAEWR